MGNRRNIIALIIGILVVIFIVKLFIMLLPLIILLGVGYWIYKKIRPNSSINYTVNDHKEKKDFDFVDVEYKNTDKK